MTAVVLLLPHGSSVCKVGKGAKVGNRGQTAMDMMEIALQEKVSVNQLYFRV